MDVCLPCRAVDIADRMMGAFDTPTGIPLGQINLGTNVSSATNWAGSGNSVLSELGSVQMEFVHLSTRSGNTSYGAAAERVIEVLHAKFGDQVRPQSTPGSQAYPAVPQQPVLHGAPTRPLSQPEVHPTGCLLRFQVQGSLSLAIPPAGAAAHVNQLQYRRPRRRGHHNGSPG